MSVLVAVRIPDELIEKMDAKGNRSRVIIEALRVLFGLEVKEEVRAQRKPRKQPTMITRESMQAVFETPVVRLAHAPICRCFICRPLGG